MNRRTFIASVAAAASLPALPIPHETIRRDWMDSPIDGSHRPWAHITAMLDAKEESVWNDYAAWRSWTETEFDSDLDAVDLYCADCDRYDGETP